MVELHHASLKIRCGGRSEENQTFVHTHFQQKGKDYKVDDSDYEVDKS